MLSLALLPGGYQVSLSLPPPPKKLGHYASCQLAASRQVPLGCVKELNMSKQLNGRLVTVVVHWWLVTVVVHW